MSKINLDIFKRKKIIISSTHKPAVFMYYHRQGKSRYVRVCFPNLIKIPKHLPMTDILVDHVRSIRVLPSEFEKWAWGLLGIKARAKRYVFSKQSPKTK